MGTDQEWSVALHLGNPGNDQRRAEGVKLIAVVGDFNDTPDSAPLEPLLKAGSDLKDIVTHPNFGSDGRPGRFGNGTASNQIDSL